MEDGEELCSYDITMLFISVPMDIHKAVACIRRKLEADDTLQERNSMSSAEIGTILDFCLSCTYFEVVFGRQFYRKIHGAMALNPLAMMVLLRG